jgi:hypothetical protein
MTEYLVFWWYGSCGAQLVLMSGDVYWWFDDTTAIFQDREGEGGSRRPQLIH